MCVLQWTNNFFAKTFNLINAHSQIKCELSLSCSMIRWHLIYFVAVVREHFTRCFFQTYNKVNFNKPLKRIECTALKIKSLLFVKIIWIVRKKQMAASISLSNSYSHVTISIRAFYWYIPLLQNLRSKIPHFFNHLTVVLKFETMPGIIRMAQIEIQK